MQVEVNPFSSGVPKIEEGKKKFIEFDLRLDTSENPERAKSQLKIQTEARLAFAVIDIEKDKPGGAEKVKEAWDKLKELYKDAIEMRAEMFPDTMRKAMTLEPGADIEGKLSEGLNTLTGKEAGHEKNLGDEMARIAKGLSDEPADVLSSQNAKSRYWYLNKKTGFPDIVQRNVNQDKKFIIEAEKQLQGVMTEELRESMSQIMMGLLELEKVNPVMTSTYEWQLANAPRKMDTKPLRLLGILGGGLIGGLGLGHALVKGHDVTWPTVMWAGVAAYSLNPNMFQGKTKDAIQAFKKYNGNGFPKTIGRLKMDSFVELRDTPKNDLKTFRKKVEAKMKSNSRIENADIGTFAEPNGPLYNVLIKLKEDPKQLLATIDLVINAPKKDLAIIEEIIEHK